MEGKSVTSHKGGGEGVAEMSPNVTWGEGGSKKCQKSVTYYLNGPFSTSFVESHLSNRKREKQTQKNKDRKKTQTKERRKDG